MAGALDDFALETAKELIDEFGKNISIKQVAEGEYNIETSTMTNTETIINLIGVVSSPKINEIDNTLIEKTDLIVTISDVIVSLEDIVTIDGRDYTIKAIMPLYSGELIAYYKLIIKG